MASEYTRWKQAAQMQCQAAMEGRTPLLGACKISVLGVFRVPESWSHKKTRLALMGQPHISKPDVDHLLQSAMDACTQIVVMDDRQFVEVSARKTYGEKPRMVITVEDLTPEKPLFQSC